jgi:hypothetical protein
VYIGNQAGQYAAGYHNVVIGNDAGMGIESSTDYQGTVLVGYGSGSGLDDNGDLNTMIGYMAGSGATGSGNVFIGANTGTGETLNQQLYIDNTDTYYPLIYGDFYNDYLAVYGDMDVSGDFYASAVSADSYAKSGVKSLENPLEKILSLSAVSYTTTGKGPENSGETVTKQHIGVYADEVEKVFPELVSKKRGSEKTVNYNGLVPVLLEAIKDQQAQIEDLRKEVEMLKQQ